MIKFAIIALTLSTTAAFATSTFAISKGGLRATTDGPATNGMSWGLLFDVNGDGFALGSYDGFNLTSNYLELTSGGAATGDVFIFAGSPGSTTVPTTIQFGPFTGSVTTVSGVEYGGPNSSPALSTAVGQNRQFGVIWFPENSAVVGSSYGFARNSDMIIPADGANFTTAQNISPLDPTYTLVPEPSTYAALLGAVVLGFVAQRRRRK